MKEAKEQYDLVAKTTKDPFIKADAHHNVGNIAMKEKQYAPAVDAFKNALRNNPNDDETRYNLALAQKLLKEQQKDEDKKDDKKDDKNKDDNKDKDDKDKNKDEKNEKDKDKKNEDGDKDKDKKGDEDKDKEDDKKKDPKDDDGKGKGDKDKKEQPKPEPQKSKLSPDQVKQLLEAMNNEENKTQQKMNAKKERGRKVKQDKDW